MVLPTFHSPIIFGSSTALFLRGIRGMSSFSMVVVREKIVTGQPQKICPKNDVIGYKSRVTTNNTSIKGVTIFDFLPSFTMMQPTPAPTSPPSSPKPHEEEPKAEDPYTYPAPPDNRGSAPFHVLVALFVKLQNEKKPDRRRRMLAAWFNV